MENKFKKGVLLGGLLAVAGVIGFVIKKHPDIKEDAQEQLKVLSKKVKGKLVDLEDITKDKFSELVTKVVDEFAEKKSLTAGAKMLLATTLVKKWEEMEEEYKKGKNE